MSRPARGRPSFGALAALAASCAVGPNYVRPEPPKAQGYVTAPPTSTAAAGGTAQHVVQSNGLAADWWSLLRSRELDDLVADGLANNPTLEAAEASLRRSQDVLRAGYGVFFPAIDASAGAGRQRYSPARVGSTVPASVFNLFTASAGVSYALDVWGGQRRAVEGLAASVDAQRYALVGARLMLAANLVNTVIAAAGYGAEIEATKDLISIEEEQVRLGEAQAEAGTVPYANVLSLKSQLASLRASLPPLEQRIDQARHLLATLVGRTPAEWSPPAIGLTSLTLPAQVPLSLPSQLVRQRPDILIAEAALHASTAQIGVSTAAMLPNLTLNASYGTNATSVTGLGSSNSIFWSAIGGITQPIFHGGALYYQRKAAIDARDQQVASYQQTVLSAFAQVADALRALTHDADTLAAETDALDSAADASHLMEINYQSGIANYLQLLTANGQLLQSRLGLVQAQAQRLQDTVSLFVALGGGWWNANAPSRPALGPSR